jgi:hypothetical protein
MRLVTMVERAKHAGIAQQLSEAMKRLDCVVVDGLRVM